MQEAETGDQMHYGQVDHGKEVDRRKAAVAEKADAQLRMHKKGKMGRSLCAMLDLVRMYYLVKANKYSYLVEEPYGPRNDGEHQLKNKIAAWVRRLLHIMHVLVFRIALDDLLTCMETSC